MLIVAENLLVVGPTLEECQDAQRGIATRPDVTKYTIKTADFGVARELGSTELATTIAGTPGPSMAPEMLRVYRRAAAAAAERPALEGATGVAGQAEEATDTQADKLQFNSSVDVYSFGTMFLEMR
jgi:serine/threonine protein kinase